MKSQSSPFHHFQLSSYWEELGFNEGFSNQFRMIPPGTENPTFTPPDRHEQITAVQIQAFPETHLKQRRSRLIHACRHADLRCAPFAGFQLTTLSGLTDLSRPRDPTSLVR